MKAVSVQGTRASTRFVVPEGWETLGHLGAGAYAAVAAFQSPRGTRYAVKKVERVLDHPVLALRTLREVRLLAHFQHPNVLRIHRFFVESPGSGDCYLCLEEMDGDLHLLIHGSKQGMAENQVQCVLYQILRGLLCLHSAHVVHRDLKPSNVLIRAGGEAKLADLGLARAIGPCMGMDAAGAAKQEEEALTEYVVTRFYRAPEVVLTATHYTYTVDMWSAGCILGEMIKGQALFQGKDSLDQIRKILSFLGRQPLEDMSWLCGASLMFAERCNKHADGQGLRQLLHWPGANPAAAELLGQMLRFDPTKRISVDDALVHAFLKDFNSLLDEEVASARAVPPMDWSFDKELCVGKDGRPRPYDAERFSKVLAELSERWRGPCSPAGDNARRQEQAAAPPREAPPTEAPTARRETRPQAGAKSPGGGAQPIRMPPVKKQQRQAEEEEDPWF